MIEPLLSDDALLKDIYSVRDRDTDDVHVWWLGQSGFLCNYQATVLLFDPYLSDSLTRKYQNTSKPHVRMSRRVVDPAELTRVHLITSTHMHTDHADAETIDAIAGANFDMWRGRPQVLVPEANLTALKERLRGLPVECVAAIEGQTYRYHFAEHPLSAVPIVAAHPELTRDDQGRPIYVGFVVRIGPVTIFHSGDGVVYDGLAAAVRAHGPIDLAILPINGKVGNMNGADAARLAKEIAARLVVPCHYDMFEFNTADPNELFVPECEWVGQAYRVLKLGERLTLRPGGEIA